MKDDPIGDLASELLDAAIQVGDENRLLVKWGLNAFVESSKRLFQVSTEISEVIHPTLEASTMKTSNIHCVKCWPKYFAALQSGVKTFDVRYNDRNYQVGDVLVSREFDPETRAYTGEMCAHRIMYVLNLDDEFNVENKDRFIVMSLRSWFIPRETEEQIEKSTEDLRLVGQGFPTAEEFLNKAFPGNWICGQIQGVQFHQDGASTHLPPGAWECGLVKFPAGHIDIPSCQSIYLKKRSRDEAIEEFARRHGWSSYAMIRASGDCRCESCWELYRRHPYSYMDLDSEGRPFLHVLCDGTKVKL